MWTRSVRLKADPAHDQHVGAGFSRPIALALAFACALSTIAAAQSSDAVRTDAGLIGPAAHSPQDVRVFPDTSSPELASASEVDRRLADIVSSYWVNFARTGNPNGRGLSGWPQYKNKETGRAMVLGDTQQPERPDPVRTATFNLYDQRYARQMARLAAGSAR